MVGFCKNAVHFIYFKTVLETTNRLVYVIRKLHILDYFVFLNNRYEFYIDLRILFWRENKNSSALLINY